MNILLVGINSKYIHPNVAIRYLKANCDFDVEILEFTIKDPIDRIIQCILEKKPDVLGFSIYIWNVEIMKNIIPLIRSSLPNIKIILGGPEVSYESDEWILEYSVDYIISGEGELSFNLLLHALMGNKSIAEVPNLKYLSNGAIKTTQLNQYMEMDELKLPSYESGFDHRNKIAYVELSRGCPFQCSYCLASLEKKVRYFERSILKEQLIDLYSKGARTFKFLDRTFNIKENIAKEVIDDISEDYFQDATFQFEVNADILSSSFIEYLNLVCPTNRVRFEIGIQSTNDVVNRAVDRHQKTAQLIENIKQLKVGNITLHLDLIAGLPYEDLNSFKKTFNDIFLLYGDELQLGFLKLLKGTKLFYQKDLHGYIVPDLAPYELIRNDYLSEHELEQIHVVEEALSIYWNKPFLKQSVQSITATIPSPFDFFFQLGSYFLKRNHSFHRYQLTDVFQTLEEFMKEEYYIYSIRKEYMMFHEIKPKLYFTNEVEKNDTVRLFHQNHPEYNINDLFKYAVAIQQQDDILLCLYYPNHTEFHKVKA